MRPGQVRNAFIAEREVREDAPPCRIGQRRESAIQYLGGIFNHLVNYVARKCRHANKKFQQLLLNDLSRINKSHLQMAPAQGRIPGARSSAKSTGRTIFTR